MHRTVLACCLASLASLAAASGGLAPPSVLHVSAEADTGTIVKTFPRDLPGLSLVQSRDSDKFYLLSSGDLMVARPLDCLAGANLSLALTHHVLNQTVLHLVNVHVHAAGDSLQFARPEHVFSVRENAPAGTEVGAVVVSGAGAALPAVSLHPVTSRKKFRAVASRGADNTATVTIATTRPLDAEVDKRLTLRLVATNPDTLETAATKLEVFVKNENDNAPVFTNKIYSLAASVAAARYSVVGAVAARDGDGDGVVYSLVPSRAAPFVVVPQTGELLLTQAAPPLKMYLLQVQARDTGSPPLRSKPALVYISFEEEEQLQRANTTTPSHSRVKRRVTRAVRPTKRTEFTEADGEPEGKIVFQLEKESEHETFKIRDENPWVTVEPNGAVRVKKKWDYEELGREKTIDFWVIITNSGSGGECSVVTSVCLHPSIIRVNMHMLRHLPTLVWSVYCLVTGVQAVMC